jgi:hypothetical protein
MNRAHKFIFCFLLLVVTPLVIAAFQKVSTRVTVYSELFMNEEGLLPLPDNAVELELVFSFNSSLFGVVQKMAADFDGNIFVSDSGQCAVFKFDAAGEFLLQIGEEGKKKGKFLSPSNIFAKESLMVQDTEKNGLEFFDFEGNFLKSIKISEFSAVVFDGKNRLYVAPPVVDKNSPLVTAYSLSGKKLFSFGKALVFQHSMFQLNARTLALNSRGELYVTLAKFPVVRKYSAGGELLGEYTIDSPITRVKEEFNLKRIGEGITNPTRRFGYMDVTVDMEYFDGKIYLMSDYPRLEILEMEEDGQVVSTYWQEYDEVYEADDFLIQGVDGEMMFYVLHSFPPEYDVDVFKKKKDIKNTASR